MVIGGVIIALLGAYIPSKSVSEKDIAKILKGGGADEWKKELRLIIKISTIKSD